MRVPMRDIQLKANRNRANTQTSLSFSFRTCKNFRKHFKACRQVQTGLGSDMTKHDGASQKNLQSTQM